MSVLISGVEMPKYGFAEIRIRPDGRVTEMLEGYEMPVGKAIHVPPHGRLVKASKVEFELCESTMPQKYRDFCRRVINDENLVPTIIPADGEEARP